jgi:hypothetical protein
LTQPSTYQLLLNNLDAFIRKFYKNQLLKGGILCFAAVVSLFVALSFTEYLGEFEKAGRTTLFYVFVLFTGFVLYRLVAIPLLKLYKIQGGLNNYDAAKIVGKHFPQINDKVLNTLQLSDAASVQQNNMDLVLASIEQKTRELSGFNFSTAINYSENKRYLKYAAIPLAVVVVILFVNASILTEGSKRLVLHAQHFEKKAPYEFVLLNKNLSVLEQSDFEIEVRTKGSVSPENLFVVIGNERYKLQKTPEGYSHTLRSVRKNQAFYFTDGEYSSKEFELMVMPKPLVADMKITLRFPKYTKKQDLTLANIGDAVVPEGTHIEWRINAKNADSVTVVFPDSLLRFNSGSSLISFTKSARQSFDYTLELANKFVATEPLNYGIGVVKDEYPILIVDEEKDSINESVRYFYGDVADDYGFTNLAFNYTIKNSANTKPQRVIIPVSKSFNKDHFFYLWDITTLGIAPGDELEYYFEVWDNDGVNGAKSTKSAIKTYKAPTLEELSQRSESASKSIKNNFEEGLKEAQKLQKELQNLQQNVLNKKSLNWQDKNQIEQFLNRQKLLEKSLEELKKDNQRNNNEQNNFRELSPEILEKQLMLEKLFDELMTDEMKKLYEELEKLMEQLDKDQIQKQLDELSLKQEEIEERLDRSLELFKQLEFEQKLESITERLDKLAEEQKDLSEKANDKNQSTEKLKEEQKEIDDRFKQVKEDLDALDKLNEELQNKKDMQNTEDLEKSIQEQLDKSQQELNNNNRKKASGAQQNASKQMRQMKQQLQQMQQSQQQQKQEEDIASLRMLLENLVAFSFDQERVMEELGKTPTSDPKYTQLGREQKKLQDDSQIIKDSLLALSKRIFQIESFINKELGEINYNMKQSIDNISDRKTSLARQNQQFVMTSANNLALMLDEVLRQLQQQSSSGQPGAGSCDKPGGAGASPSMQQMQQQLQQQLEKMKQQMEQGKQEGGQKPGGEKNGEGKGKDGMGGMPSGGSLSKELAKMAAQQEAIRKEIQRLAQELNKDGSGSGNGLNDAAKKLEQVEKDLVNKRITPETIKRQQEIMTRLLEHEKAQREQEQDDKRESNESKNQKFSNPTKYFEYKSKKEQEVELLKTIPPGLNEYYKNKVNEFFKLHE